MSSTGSAASASTHAEPAGRLGVFAGDGSSSQERIGLLCHDLRAEEHALLTLKMS